MRTGIPILLAVFAVAFTPWDHSIFVRVIAVFAIAVLLIFAFLSHVDHVVPHDSEDMDRQ